MSMPSPPPMPGGGTPNWWSRNWKWFVPTLAVALLTLFVVAILALVFFIASQMKSTDVYQEAMRRAQCSYHVAVALGAPVEGSFMPKGNLSVNGGRNGSGTAVMNDTLTGPLGSGDLFIDATRSKGVWAYNELSVRLEGGDFVDLTHPDFEDGQCPSMPDGSDAADAAIDAS